jgi:hypothetical protein
MHVLPDGFQRIRYYGFLGNRYREQKLAHCRELFGMPTAEPPTLETAKELSRALRRTHRLFVVAVPGLSPRPNAGHPDLAATSTRQVSIKDTS